MSSTALLFLHSQICIYQKFVVPLHRQRDNLGPPTGANVVHPVGRAETPNAQMTTLSSVNARGCRQRRTFASSKGPQDFVYCVQIISGQSAPPPSFSPITRNVLPLSEGVASAEKGIKNNHQSPITNNQSPIPFTPISASLVRR